MRIQKPQSMKPRGQTGGGEKSQRRRRHIQGTFDARVTDQWPRRARLGSNDFACEPQLSALASLNGLRIARLEIFRSRLPPPSRTSPLPPTPPPPPEPPFS